ncbi:MAG TPA: sugar ABC transporter permease [Halanaerobiaceae bacterium]|nr:sugar ABC transporter permease [Bacillota bacterium]HHU92138.1 sugar ABC transporter permease [Halanaerobiaceae bacterium]
MKMNMESLTEKKVRNTSLLFMGLAHILYLKDYLKGSVFALIELIFLVSIPKVIKNISNLITLGTPKPNLPIFQRDNSTYMLFDGIITIIFILLFFLMYYISVKSARKSYQEYKIKGRRKNFRESLADISTGSFSLFGLLPALLLVVFFVLVPLIFSACVAFTNYSAPNHITPNNVVDWVGLDNFRTLFGGDILWGKALGRVSLWTLVWALLATTTCFFGGFIIAVILRESKIKIAPVFRGIFILPYAVPSVISMLVWQNLLNGSFGTVNRTLMKLGIIDKVIPWLSDPWLAKFTVVMINLWAGYSYFMLLTTGSMTAISQDIYDAARIDGANSFQVFSKITFPLVIYQTMPLLVMSFTHNINNFGAIFFLTGGKPVVADSATTSAGGTDILITWIYDLTINLQKYNMGAALAVMIFIILAPFAIFNFSRTKSFKEGEL